MNNSIGDISSDGPLPRKPVNTGGPDKTGPKDNEAESPKKAKTTDSIEFSDQSDKGRYDSLIEIASQPYGTEDDPLLEIKEKNLFEKLINSDDLLQEEKDKVIQLYEQWQILKRNEETRSNISGITNMALAPVPPPESSSPTVPTSKGNAVQPVGDSPESNLGDSRQENQPQPDNSKNEEADNNDLDTKN